MALVWVVRIVIARYPRMVFAEAPGDAGLLADGGLAMASVSSADAAGCVDPVSQPGPPVPASTTPASTTPASPSWRCRGANACRPGRDARLTAGEPEPPQGACAAGARRARGPVPAVLPYRSVTGRPGTGLRRVRHGTLEA